MGTLGATLTKCWTMRAAMSWGRARSEFGERLLREVRLEAAGCLQCTFLLLLLPLFSNSQPCPSGNSNWKGTTPWSVPEVGVGERVARRRRGTFIKQIAHIIRRIVQRKKYVAGAQIIVLHRVKEIQATCFCSVCWKWMWANYRPWAKCLFL